MSRLYWSGIATSDGGGLISADPEGIVRLWDMAVPREFRRLHASAKCLDSLGVVRPVESAPAIAGLALVEARRYPALETTVRLTGSSAVRNFCYYRAAPLLDDAAAGDLLHFACEGLKLTEISGRPGFFEPWRDPAHRGHAGICGFFTAAKLWNAAANWPLIKHVPLYPVRLEHLAFADGEQEPRELAFHGILINPADLAIERDTDAVAEFVLAAAGRGARPHRPSSRR
ncbi:MAG: hypothetical protein QM775_34190 [Pirellulales bacterium]